MKDFYITALNNIKKLNISYMVGADSLVGLSEGGISKYSSDLKIFIFPVPWWKWLALAMILLPKRMFLKPKDISRGLFFKLRFRKLSGKDANWVKLFPLRKVDGKYVIRYQNNELVFNEKDLRTEKVILNGVELSVPVEMKKFVSRYKRNLMTDYLDVYPSSIDEGAEVKAVELLDSVKQILEENDIAFWIEGGTLLGAVRDGKFIPWDHDLDMGMIFESDAKMRRLIRDLRKQFHVSVKGFPERDDIWQLGKYRVLKIFPRKHKVLKDSLCLDLFVYYRSWMQELNREVYKYVVWYKNAYHETRFFDTREKMEFYGLIVPVPSNPREFLEVKYGKNWRTPIKEWNVSLQDGSVYRENNHHDVTE